MAHRRDGVKQRSIAFKRARGEKLDDSKELIPGSDRKGDAAGKSGSERRILTWELRRVGDAAKELRGPGFPHLAHERSPSARERKRLFHLDERLQSGAWHTGIHLRADERRPAFVRQPQQSDLRR